jgi:hypothetical protein
MELIKTKNQNKNQIKLIDEREREIIKRKEIGKMQFYPKIKVNIITYCKKLICLFKAIYLLE